ncbi:GGDEF domain-containing response regulator [Pseudalkalibacillus berkeleyi]|uniref:Diguanylate cyclase n=1 Tax=Pseudalkalibacillus berkeleyi TaxID=1069813 RepID=A0ABS9H339_9BACL|nr:diguanylate cyclase [Pseudalkalibacillus berkeleyi]MCF6138273.1 diguanylate cyclase [Pseudalkalibacillus berkeleyi]
MIKLDKYRQHFFNNVRNKLDEWEKVSTISNFELYRFLHSIAGTSPMIGLEEIGAKARNLMDELNEDDERVWTIAEAKQWIYEIIVMCYTNEEELFSTFVQLSIQREDKPVILLVDDDTSFLMYIKEQIEQIGWYVVAIANPQKAIMSFYDVRPDCVVIDIHMQETDGFKVLQFLKEKLKQQFIPTVMVSIDDKKENRMKSYELGADDFIKKPFDIDEFTARLGRQLHRKQQIDELLLVDELTQVYNRKYLKQEYDKLTNYLIRYNETFCLAVLDLDKFKNVNDKYGHLVGDLVLQQFSSFLNKEARLNDTIVRYGGEEFIILFPKTNVEDAYKVLDRLCKGFAEHSIEHNGSFSCTFSGGVVEVTSGDRPLNEWIELADAALYEAKNSGRNHIKMAKPSVELAPSKVIKIAIVDDDPIIRTVLSDIVTKLPKPEHTQFDIQTFSDGSLFVQNEWHKKSRCLVILDGVMPKMDGLEVLHELRSQLDSERYKVLMLTSRKSEMDIARALQLGADDYITKPFKLYELEARLSQIIKRMS